LRLDLGEELIVVGGNDLGEFVVLGGGGQTVVEDGDGGEFESGEEVGFILDHLQVGLLGGRAGGVGFLLLGLVVGLFLMMMSALLMMCMIVVVMNVLMIIMIVIMLMMVIMVMMIMPMIVMPMIMFMVIIIVVMMTMLLLLLFLMMMMPTTSACINRANKQSKKYKSTQFIEPSCRHDCF
jgi:hypothetical protein